jgi:predicted PurR-regulated permease PerM
MPETNRETRSVAAAGTSLRIIASAIVVAALYYASSILITLICAVFIAFVLEPPVRLMERLRIPRWVGSLLVVACTLAVIYVLVYLAYDHVVDFLNTIPRVVATVQRIVARLELWARSLGPGASTLLPSAPDTSVPTVRLQEESPWTQFLLRGIGSVYAFTVTVAFIPFLVFFMLASKNHIWAATLNLFPIDRRQQTEDVIAGITAMVRQFVLGNILVALISAVMILPVFLAISLPYPFLMALFAAFLSVIPYIGVALGMLPPLLMAAAHDDSVGHLVAIAVVVFLVHFVAVNVLTPKLVGRRVKLNALSVTLSMMFWGWLWGGLGLVLAVPITAGLKAICDNIQSLKPFGAWMGEG